ncbi:hypothetical protein BGZ97_001261 [Linnemannia gamsii]|uniref:Uncharacterized protein n=1 Tax=Linnemannia gamsii TaxID=64522 RepID=A0A9P6UJG8_9FUNG|nr:hypothetical protein BGZ97_001261 [Linnemannia gamsii]
MIVQSEVLSHVGNFLGRPSFYACTPYAHWSPDQEKATDTMEERQQRFSTQIQRYRLHIRDLKVKNLGLLRAAFEANLTGLVSLRLEPSQFKSS